MSSGSPRRAAIAWGALLALVSYWAIALGFVVPEYDGGGIRLSNEVASGGPLLVGLLLIPIALASITFLSHHDDPLPTVARAVVAAGVVGVAVAAIATIPAGVVGGLGAGAAISLRLPEHADVTRRWWYVAAGVAVSLILHALAPQVSVFVSAVLPVVAVGLADGVAGRD